MRKLVNFSKKKSVANKQNVIQFTYCRLKLWLIEDVAYKYANEWIASAIWRRREWMISEGETMPPEQLKRKWMCLVQNRHRLQSNCIWLGWYLVSSVDFSAFDLFMCVFVSFSPSFRFPFPSYSFAVVNATLIDLLPPNELPAVHAQHVTLHFHFYREREKKIFPKRFSIVCCSLTEPLLFILLFFLLPFICLRIESSFNLVCLVFVFTTGLNC